MSTIKGIASGLPKATAQRTTMCWEGSNGGQKKRTSEPRVGGGGLAGRGGGEGG